MDIYRKLIEKALKLVVSKRYTGAELNKKLRHFVGKLERLNEGLSFTSEEVDEAITNVMVRLRELKYVDDQKFANDYVSDRTKFKPRGKFMISRELRKKGLSKHQIASAVLGVDEIGMARDLIEKKASRWKDDSPRKQREKAYRFLVSKGFGVDAIYKAIESHYNRNS